ncbi:diguanylate cyclase [Pseudidiomarina sp.]|uniref:sensor domain-containing diguanylate cyclase n=1 Tax=Pseudidiomarina sp. TaxID=2081707 RepID=UPI00299F07B2|nr:diguanylate cyclase [Pseudidiomarina sp.]MDX1706315.1 diguanylate cyclase [Pseudidiomarina sp.]
MKPAPIPANEQERLAQLHELEILDTEPAQTLDEIVAFARELFGVDAALITLVDEDRQWFKAKAGFSEKETPRDVSFCAHVVASGKTTVVENASKDPRFSDNPYVVAPDGIRFYAGAPLTINEFHLGTLCLIDSSSRTFRDEQLRWLEMLAKWVTTEILARHERESWQAEREVLAKGPVATVVWQIHPEVHLIYVAENSERILGYKPDYLLDPAIHYESIVHTDDREELLDRMQKLIDGEDDYLEMDYRVLTPNQEVRWVHHFARLDTDPAGNMLRIRGYLLDDTKGKELELELREANQSFDLALTAGELSTWDWNFKSNAIRVSRTWLKLLGYDQDDGVSSDWQDLIHPEDKPEVTEKLKAHLKGARERLEAKFRLQCADGQYIWMHSVGRVIARGQDGRAERMVGIHRDITAEVHNEERRRQQDEVLELVSEVQHQFLLVKNFSDVCDIALPALMSLTDSSAGFIGELESVAGGSNMFSVQGLRHSDNAALDANRQRLVEQYLEVELTGTAIEKMLQTGKPEVCNSKISRETAHFMPPVMPPLTNAFFLPIYFRRKVIGCLVLGNRHDEYETALLGLLEPILNTLGTLMHMRRVDEERQAAVEELRKLATVDELTGVANRRVFLDVCKQRFDEKQRYDVAMSVAVLDLDLFKRVNDTHGHAAGDQVLREFAAIAKSKLREPDMLGRMGGEEFAILFPYTGEEEALQATERVRMAIADNPIEWEGKKIELTVSAGVAELKAEDNDIDRWIARADSALYEAKDNGRNRSVRAKKV